MCPRPRSYADQPDQDNQAMATAWRRFTHAAEADTHQRCLSTYTGRDDQTGQPRPRLSARAEHAEIALHPLLDNERAKSSANRDEAKSPGRGAAYGVVPDLCRSPPTSIERRSNNPCV